MPGIEPGSKPSRLQLYALAALRDIATVRVRAYRCDNLFGQEGRGDEAYECGMYVADAYADHSYSHSWLCPSFVDVEILYASMVMVALHEFRPETIDLVYSQLDERSDATCGLLTRLHAIDPTWPTSIPTGFRLEVLRGILVRLVEKPYYLYSLPEVIPPGFAGLTAGEESFLTLQTWAREHTSTTSWILAFGRSKVGSERELKRIREVLADVTNDLAGKREDPWWP